MRREKLKRLVAASLFAALTCAATMLLRIPSPATGGYTNLGDGVLLLGALLLGPLYGAAAGGVGAGLADLLGGYALYVPGTLCVKGAEAAAAALLFRVLRRRVKPGAAWLIAAAAAACLMAGGYFCYSALVLGIGAGAAASIPGNLVQGACGAVLSAALRQALLRVPELREKWFSE